MTKSGIAVAVDGSAESDAAVRWAAREALLREANVTLVHVVAPVVVTWPVGYLRASYAEWQEENAQHVVEQAQKIFQAEVGNETLPAVKAQVLHDYAAPGLVAASRDAEMIVAGSRSLGGERLARSVVLRGRERRQRCYGPHAAGGGLRPSPARLLDGPPDARAARRRAASRSPGDPARTRGASAGDLGGGR